MNLSQQQQMYQQSQLWQQANMYTNHTQYSAGAPNVNVTQVKFVVGLFF